MWWQDWLMGIWNGLTAWVVLIVHVFGGWPEYPFYDLGRGGNWYDFGFLIGAGSPLLGFLGAGRDRATRPVRTKVSCKEEKSPEDGGFGLPT